MTVCLLCLVIALLSVGFAEKALLKNVLSLGNNALVIVDVQNCFMPSGTLPVPDGDQVVPVINDIRAKYEKEFALVVRTREWHCSDQVSFVDQHPGHHPFDVIELCYTSNFDLCEGPDTPHGSYTVPCNATSIAYRLNQTLWPSHCVINTRDAEFYPTLVVKDTDVIVRKGYHCQVDSYSAFFDNGHFEQTGLQSILKANKIQTIFFVGLAYDYCVYFSAKDAKDLGYNVYVIQDATKYISSITRDAATADMKRRGINIISSAELSVIASLGTLRLLC